MGGGSMGERGPMGEGEDLWRVSGRGWPMG